MPDKKDPFRFTLKFNQGDPLHAEVVRILNARGNAKAQYLVDTVMHFESCPARDGSNFGTDDNQLLVHIERVVRDAVRAECSGMRLQTTIEEEGMAPVPAAADESSVEELDRESIARIGESIRAFRR